MRVSKGKELSCCESWNGFRMHFDKLELPTGQLVTAQEILTGIALLEIESELDIATKANLLKYARAIASIKNSHK